MVPIETMFFVQRRIIMTNTVLLQHALSDEELFCLEGCRTYPQYFAMRQSFESGACTFCTLDRKDNVLIWENEVALCWTVPKKYMRAELKYHFIYAPKRHIRYEWDLTNNEVLSMHKVRKALAFEFDLSGGITATRFGNMQLNAGTVPHLHTNLMVPNGTGKVSIPVFKDPSEHEKNKDRVTDFAHRYAAFTHHTD